jgi:CRISPR-associated protein Cst2
MLKFVTFAVKTQLNVHDLNNEAVAGNVTDIRVMEFLDENGERQEAPAVSGRMLKHWHYEAMKHLIVNGSYTIPLCAGCRAGEPIRPSEIQDGNLRQVAKSEQDAVTSCAACDIHGYLIAREAEGEQERGISARRISRAMFSWLMPVLNKETTSKQVIHNRVSQQKEIATGGGSAQMIFDKSYASGIYAFVSALDVDRIGLVELNLGSPNPYAVDDNNGRRNRIKVAIEAYRYLISGQMGASLSHAVPHGNPLEILVAFSENGPLPFPVSPMYSDYISKTTGLMPQNTKLLYWGSETPTGVIKKSTINEIFTELINKVDGQ